MVEGIAEFTPKEQLKRELMFHANTSANRALNWSARATFKAMRGNESIASVYNRLAIVDSNDAIEAAYEAGEVDATNLEKKDPDDPVYSVYMDKAGESMDDAMNWMMEAQALLMEGSDPAAAKEEAIRSKREALTEAYRAGLYMGDGRRSGVIPTFTLDP